ncbi:MAG: hypothetical protein IIC87_02950 [Chloroflexi bacterium]|nr:hypothetical protein [Chloroflexota bacterium]
MWGKYYLCAGCGFTAEDDDELHTNSVKAMPPLMHELTQIETFRHRQAATRQ